MEPRLISKNKCFGGTVEFYSHSSTTCHSEMKFSVYRPAVFPANQNGKKFPILYWLSGLTCTDENFIAKAGAERLASELGLFLVCPDTSPRNTGIVDEAKDWECGAGAGFYVDATTSKWSGFFKMYSYVTDELPNLIHAHFPVDPTRESISGHSMGGHGALVAALRQPGRYRSVSAFSPIVAPTLVPWGQKAFREFLGENTDAWANYDAHRLISIAKGPRIPVLVDQGLEDKFLANQLMPEKLEEAAAKNDYPIELRRQAGYDHSYYFISTFIDDHLRFHALHLK